MSGRRLGVIADDLTGAGDVADAIARGGLPARLFCGVPPGPEAAPPAAAVVALKSRTIPAGEAVAQSLAAADWLLAQGYPRLLFKVCSTFDSRPDGNIGPVAEALAARLGEAHVVVCPAFPATGRLVFEGHLFVGGRLLSETGMARHPLTPMTDPDLRRWLALQTGLPVVHLRHDAVAAGVDAAGAALERAPGLAVADAAGPGDLAVLGAVAAGRRLSVGASGLAEGLAAALAGGAAEAPAPWRGEAGPAAILAGSCSEATLAQVARHGEGHPRFAVDPEAVLAGKIDPGALADEMLAAGGLPLAHSSADAALVAAAQARHGAGRLAAALEGFFGDLAAALVAGGVRRLVVAGGETSGAAIDALGLRALDIGPAIAPGVPAMRACERPLVLALKSGNFGGPDFFAEAAGALGP